MISPQAFFPQIQERLANFNEHSVADDIIYSIRELTENIAILVEQFQIEVPQSERLDISPLRHSLFPRQTKPVSIQNLFGTNNSGRAVELVKSNISALQRQGLSRKYNEFSLERRALLHAPAGQYNASIHFSFSPDGAGDNLCNPSIPEFFHSDLTLRKAVELKAAARAPLHKHHPNTYAKIQLQMRNAVAQAFEESYGNTFNATDLQRDAYPNPPFSSDTGLFSFFGRGEIDFDSAVKSPIQEPIVIPQDDDTRLWLAFPEGFAVADELFGKTLDKYNASICQRRDGINYLIFRFDVRNDFSETIKFAKSK